MYNFNYYSILGLSHDFTREELDEAFKSKMLFIQTKEDFTNADKQNAYKIVSDIYYVLSSQKLKEEYDDNLCKFYRSYKKQLEAVTKNYQTLLGAPFNEETYNLLEICTLTLEDLNYVRDNNWDIGIFKLSEHKFHKVIVRRKSKGHR